jgi:DNA-binding NarL/FixJ family response regulator
MEFIFRLQRHDNNGVISEMPLGSSPKKTVMRRLPSALRCYHRPMHSATSQSRGVFLVDDHPMLRQGLKELLDSMGLQCCGEADDEPTALQEIPRRSPDLVIVDISLKKGDGLELIKKLKAQGCEAPALVSSMHDEKIYAERALHAGARGYISKDAPTETLIKAIKRVLDGGIYLSEAMSQRALQRVVDGDPELSQSPIDLLSDRELEVLELIGKGLATREIAERLGLSVKTIDTYRENLKTKLNLSTANELIRYAVIWTQTGR